MNNFLGSVNWARLLTEVKVTELIGPPAKANRPFAAKPSRDLLFIKLWAIT